MTDHVFAYVLSIVITSGRMTSCITGQMMAGRSGRSTYWTNIAGNVWLSGSNGSCTQLRSSMLSRTCSSCAACQLTSGQITAQSSSLRLSETGSKRSEQRPRISSLGHPGKTATAKASMGGCETNCSTAKSFTRCAKHKSSSKAGGNTTTPSDHTVHWATAHQRPKPSSRWTKGRSCTNF